MPGKVTATNAQGAPTISTDADFGLCVVGYSTSSPVSAGSCTNPYSNPQSAVGDLGLGDAVDCLLQGIVPRPTNPAPQGIFFYATPATTPGVRGSTLTTSGVTGMSVVTKTTGTHPIGTFQPVGKVLVGGTVGSPGIYIAFSPDGGRTFLPAQALGSNTTLKMQITINGVATDTGVQYDFTSATLNAGDTWSESKTTPPMWADADLYTAGPPASGAFAAIANSANPCGLIVISEPVAAGDFATLVAGLNYIETFNKHPRLLVRFRDPTSSETDAQYIAAFQTFALACRDSRITCVVGSGWLTDAFRAFVYFRSGLPAVVARLQGAFTNPGRLGERLAKSPAYVGDGGLPDFTLRDTNGNPIAQAHDEASAGGVDGPLSDGGGGGVTFYFNQAQGVVGTYVSEAPCLFAPGSTVLTLMDARVTGGIMTTLVAIAWTYIQGANVVNNGILDPDAASAMAQTMRKAIEARYANEIANPADPNLVVVNPAVTVNGANISLTVSVNDRLFDYLNGVTITLYNIR